MTLFLANEDIAGLLSPAGFIETLHEAYSDYAAGNGVTLPRLDIQGPPQPDGALYQLGLAVGTVGQRYAAIRLKSDMIFKRMVDGQPRKEKYCVEPGKFMGLILLFSIQNGELLAIMQDGLIQKLRVGCDSALGVRLLARPDAAVLGILGAGGMAQTHLDAIRTVRELREVRFYSPTPRNREAIAAQACQAGLNAVAAETPEALFRGADMVAACTTAIGPVVPGALLEPGMHITCIGGTLDDAASARLDVALRFGNASVPAEFPGMAQDEDCLTFAASGKKAEHGSAQRYASPPAGARILLADLIADAGRGRTRPEQITFSERGAVHGIEFAAIAGMVFERAAAAALGRHIPTEMFLETIRN